MSEEWREINADKEREKELKEKRSAEWKKKRESNSNKRKDKAAVQYKKTNENASLSRIEVSLAMQRPTQSIQRKTWIEESYQYQHLKLKQTQLKKNI